jgi:hypothetical protein
VAESMFKCGIGLKPLHVNRAGRTGGFTMTDEKPEAEDPQSKIQSREDDGFIPLPLKPPRFRGRRKDSADPEDDEPPE